MAAEPGEAAETRKPRVLVPYAGPDAGGEFSDIFVYLRPESNGVVAESAILKVIENCSAYRDDLFLAYMANLPGDFISRQRLVERHYAVKLVFAVHGGAAFTPHMRKTFERHFGEDFEKARPIGAFQALDELGVRADDLFSVWVPESRMLVVDGQTIKRVWGRYIVNYDIPALLHRNTAETDIAVMLFRTRRSYQYFADLTRQMKDAVVQQGVIRPGDHFTRVFHYSKSPFEQMLDARGHLLSPEGDFLSIERSSFGRFCLDRGMSVEQLNGLLDNPICTFLDGEYRKEEHLFTQTSHLSYVDAYAQAQRIVAQAWLVK